MKDSLFISCLNTILGVSMHCVPTTLTTAITPTAINYEQVSANANYTTLLDIDENTNGFSQLVFLY